MEISENSASCFSKQRQEFLICATIHKARNLNILNADTFVVVNFQNSFKQTKIYQNSDCPYFNEYFVFEFNGSLEDLLKKNLRITVFENSCCIKKDQIIGELIINLSTIWKQKCRTT